MNIKKSRIGISLLEAIISIAILTVTATILMSAFGSFRAASDLTEAHSSIAGILKDARGKTLSSENKSNYGVHFQSDQAVLFKGNSYNPSDTNNDIYLLPTSIEISSVSLTNGAVDAVFTRLLGTTTAYGTITLRSLRNSSTKTITILQSGNISSAPSINVPTAGLTAYWQFDEGSGSIANDSSGNNNHGSLLNMNLATSWVAGKIGQALLFDGNDDYISVPASVSLNIAGGITVALWVRPSVNSSSFHNSWNYFIYQRNPLKYEIGYYNTGGPRFKPYNESGTNFDFSASTALTANTWYHMAFVRNGSFLGIYIDGALADSRNDFTGDLRSSTEVRIGGAGSNNSAFIGTVDDVRIYNRALTTSEIQQLYAFGG